MTDGDTMTFVQALVRLWDSAHRGYTMQEVARELGWPVDDEAEAGNDAMDRPAERYAVAAITAMADGLVATGWGVWAGTGERRRLLLRPVLG